MTPTELILMHLAIRPMAHNDLMRATGLRRPVLTSTLTVLEGDGQVWRNDGNGHGREWTIGADPLRRGNLARDYSVEREKIAPGHTVVRFGDRWRAGHGLRPPATPGMGNALGNIYA